MGRPHSTKRSKNLLIITSFSVLLLLPLLLFVLCSFATSFRIRNNSHTAEQTPLPCIVQETATADPVLVCGAKY